MIFSFSRNVFFVIGLMSFLMCFPSNLYSQLIKRNILSNSASIMLPSSFAIMDVNLMETKYPPTNKPTEVYTNLEATVNVAFKKTELALPKSNVFVEGKKLEQQLIRSGKVQLISSEKLKANGDIIHVFSFYSKAIDTKVYNIMIVFSLKGKMVIGSFNCAFELQNQWQVTAYEIIHSLKTI